MNDETFHLGHFLIKALKLLPSKTHCSLQKMRRQSQFIVFTETHIG